MDSLYCVGEDQDEPEPIPDTRHHVINGMYGYLPDNLSHYDAVESARESAQQDADDYEDSGFIVNKESDDSWTMGHADPDREDGVSMGGFFRYIHIEPCVDPQCQDYD
jgi:hypothetical protein